ncbi:MAG TPA: endolytic transglycosylase MltG [Acidimicrobiales bacterium]|nr:endolytic transglycosylase MltG [Acidimicrobiales bacterium]
MANHAERREPTGRSRALVVAGLVAAVVAAGALWFVLQMYPVFASGHRRVIVTVSLGQSFAQVAGDLHRAGVIASPFAFRLEAVVLGAPIVQPGAYEMRQGASFSSVRAILAGGPNVALIDNSAGLTTYELYQQVAGSILGTRYATALQRALPVAAAASPYHHGTSPEGLIGARSYLVTPETSPKRLAHEMVAAFDTEAARAGLTPTTTVNGLDAYQLVVAASIVEKEGYYPKNMPRVARVIYNRLALGDALQMDATVLYALHIDGGTVTHAIEQTPSPYNTYLHSGLPPTPICTVSPSALSAVLHAPPGPWLYFEVIDRAGNERFSRTFAQQLAAEALAAKRGL